MNVATMFLLRAIADAEILMLLMMLKKGKFVSILVNKDIILEIINRPYLMMQSNHLHLTRYNILVTCVTKTTFPFQDIDGSGGFFSS